MNQQAHYFLSPVLVYDGPDLKMAMTRALISRQSIYKVFEEGEQIYRDFLAGRSYRVRLDGIDYNARLVRESGLDGSHYNLRLLGGSTGRDDHLEVLMGRYGFSSPWKRDYARISSAALNEQVEVPVSAILHRFSGQTEVIVRNFSYHGLFVELQCAGPSMGEMVGRKVGFQIITSRGALLDEAQGRIARIYDEMLGPKKLKRGLGIRILEMRESARKAYHDMILGSCREIQKAAKA
jgi:hypothetical protein